MRIWIAIGVGLATLSAACGGNDGAKPIAAPAAPGQAAAEPASLPPAAGAAEPLRVALRVERSADGVGLSVTNPGPSAVALEAAVALEQAQGERFVTLDERALTLRLSCQSHGCVTLAPGAELLAPSWLGQISGERCDARVVPKAPGSYRLRVRRCGNPAAEPAHAAFAWPAP